MGGTVGIVHSDVLCRLCARLCIRYLPIGIGEVHGMDMHASQPSWLGQSRKLAVLWTAGGSTRGVRITSTSTNVRNQRIAVLWHAPSHRLRDARLRIVLILVHTNDVCVRVAFPPPTPENPRMGY